MKTEFTLLDRLAIFYILGYCIGQQIIAAYDSLG
jgi:hypothetical protein